jgi:hypothetical protein
MTAGTEEQTAGVPVKDAAGSGGRPGLRLIDALWAGSVLIAVAGAVLTGLTWSGFKATASPRWDSRSRRWRTLSGR